MIYSVISSTVYKVSISILFLVASIVTHIILKTYYNVKMKKDCWNVEKFKEGFSKLFVVVISTYLLSVTLAFFPMLLVLLGVTLEKDLVEYLNLTTILVIMLKPTIAYIKKNVETLEKIIENILPEKFDSRLFESEDLEFDEVSEDRFIK